MRPPPVFGGGDPIAEFHQRMEESSGKAVSNMPYVYGVEGGTVPPPPQEYGPNERERFERENFTQEDKDEAARIARLVWLKQNGFVKEGE